MGRKNKTKAHKVVPPTVTFVSSDESQTSPVARRVETQESQGETTVEEMIKTEFMDLLQKTKLEESYKAMKSQLEQREAELVVAKDLINTLKYEEIHKLKAEIYNSKSKITEMDRSTQLLEEEKRNAEAQIEKLKEKLLEKETLSRTSSAIHSQLDNNISEDLIKTNQQMEKAQQEIIALERKLDDTNRLFEESKTSSESERSRLLKMLEEKDGQTEVELKNCKLDLEGKNVHVLKLESQQLTLINEKAELQAKYEFSIRNTKALVETVAELKLELENSSRLAASGDVKLNEELASAKATYDSMQKKYEAQFGVLNEAVQKFQEDFNLLKVELTESRLNCDRLMHEAKTATEQRDLSWMRIKTLEKSEDWSLTRINTLGAAVVELKKRLETAVAEKNKSEQSLKNADKRFSAKSKTTNKEIVNLKENVKRLTAELEAAKMSQGVEKKTLEQEDAEIKKKDEEIGSLKKVVTDLEEKLRIAQEEVISSGALVAGSLKKIETLEISATQAAIEAQKVVKLESRVEELQRSAENRQKRLESELDTVTKQLQEAEIAFEKERNESRKILEKGSATLSLLDASLYETVKKCNESEKLRQQELSRNEALTAELKKLQDGTDEVQEKILAAERAEKNKKVSELQASIDSLKSKSAAEKKALEDEVTHLRDKLGRAESLANQLEAECKKIAVIDQSCAKSVEEEKKKLTDEIKSLESKLEGAEKNLNEAEIEIKRLKDLTMKNEEKLQQTVQDSEKKNGEDDATASMKKELDECKEKFAVEKAELSAKLNKAENDFHNYREEHEKLLAAEAQKFADIQKTAEEEKRALNAEIHRLNDIRSSNDKKQRKLMHELSVAKNDLKESVKISNRLRAEIEKLQNDVAGMVKEAEVLASLRQQLREEEQAAIESDVRLHELIEDLKKKLNKSENLAKEKTAECEKLKKNEEEVVSNLRKTSEEHINRLNKEMDRTKNVMMKMNKELKTKFEKELLSSKTQLEQARKFIEEEKTAYSKRLEELEAEKLSAVETLRKELQTARDQFEQLKTSTADEKLKLEAEIASVKQKLVEAEKNVIEEKVECVRLKELEARKVEVLQQSADDEKQRLKSELSLTNAKFVKVIKEYREMIKKKDESSRQVEEENIIQIKEKESHLRKLESEMVSLATELEKVTERNGQLESRMEEQKRSASNRQNRLEEELNATRQRLQDADRLAEARKRAEQAIAQLEGRLIQLETASEQERVRLSEIAQRATQKLAVAEENEQNRQQLVNELQSRLEELKAFSENERKKNEEELAKVRLQLSDSDSGRIDRAKASESSSSEKSDTVVEIDAKNREAVVNVTNAANVPIEVAAEEEWDENLPFNIETIDQWWRQISRRVGLLRHNSTFAIYPFIRYAIAAYIIILHLYIFW